jgi:hypothetical protein
MGVFSRASFGASGNLGKISEYIKNPNADDNSKIWNYGKYAYISIQTNGTNNAGLCSPASGVTLGDNPLNSSEKYNSLISRDGSRDVPAKPLLESVRINNDGSNDVSDSALFDIDVSFKCYSKSQFATYESAFFRVGNGVTLSFGYKGLGFGASMSANVYNFGFSMDASGVYSCNLKLTGKNRFSAVLAMDQTLAGTGTTIKDEEDNDITAFNIPSELNNRFITAFPEYEESSVIQKGGTKDFVPDGEAKLSGGYAVANIQTKSGADFKILGMVNVDFDDMFVKYVKFSELIDVINTAHSNSGFKWGFGDAKGKFIPQFASADPSKLLLDGDMATYGETAATTFNDGIKNNLATGTGFDGNAKDMLISLDLINTTIDRLVERAKEDKDAKGESSVNNFLRVLCATIKDLTGGLYPLTIYNDGFKNSNKFLIVNERAEHQKGISAAYTFKTHDLGSVLKSVNLSSNMDSDMAAAALVSNRGGEIPKGAFDNLYNDCGPNLETTAPPVQITLDDIQKKKEELGTGLSAERSQGLKDIMKSYISNKPAPTGTDTGYRYMIDLSVTCYGVWGTNIGDTFSFDGLPAKYIGAGKYFCVGKMEHSFDGQGNWETSFTGFLKLDAQ